MFRTIKNILIGGDFLCHSRPTGSGFDSQLNKMFSLVNTTSKERNSDWRYFLSPSETKTCFLFHFGSVNRFFCNFFMQQQIPKMHFMLSNDVWYNISLSSYSCNWSGSLKVFHIFRCFFVIVSQLSWRIKEVDYDLVPTWHDSLRIFSVVDPSNGFVGL